VSAWRRVRGVPTNSRKFLGRGGRTLSLAPVRSSVLSVILGSRQHAAAGWPKRLVIADRELCATPVFDTYWRFAAARQAVYLARLSGHEAPWTTDDILQRYRFTNSFRAADRVSQYLIRHVIYSPGAAASSEDMVFRVLLFKIFNKVSTWETLESVVGTVSWDDYQFDVYASALDAAALRGPIYSPAYMMPPPRLGERDKRRNHLRLLEQMMRDGLGHRVTAADSLEAVFETLMSYPSMGRFLAFQFTIDLNYSTVLSRSEDEFVVAGPGAVDGIRKCFGPQSRGIEAQIIKYMTETQQDHFDRLGLSFNGLFGRQLHLIDCQNLFCEVDKYARVAHPEVRGHSGRTRIKQTFRRNRERLEAFFPPKWDLVMPPFAGLSPSRDEWSPTLFS
jgi:hypothetical protein